MSVDVVTSQRLSIATKQVYYVVHYWFTTKSIAKPHQLLSATRRSNSGGTHEALSNDTRQTLLAVPRGVTDGLFSITSAYDNSTPRRSCSGSEMATSGECHDRSQLTRIYAPTKIRMYAP
jgi:hypothetical protein